MPELIQKPGQAIAPDVNLTPQASEETVNALDVLLKAEEEVEVKTPEQIASEKAAEEAAAASKAAEDAAQSQNGTPPAKTEAEIAAEAAKVGQSGADGTPPAKTEAEIAAEAAKTAEDAVKAAAAAKKDQFEDLQLPPHVSPKATEAFAGLKTAARTMQADLNTKLTAAEKRAQELESRLAEAEAKAGKVPEEVDKELADLRRFRQAVAIEDSPEIKSFDQKAAANEKSIMAKLKDAGVTEATLAKIVELGGTSKVEMDPILEKLPSTQRRLIEAKLIENEQLADSKAEKLAEAKTNSEKFFTEKAVRDKQEAMQLAGSLLKEVPWAIEQPIPNTASDADKAKIGAWNRAARENQGRLTQLLSVQTPARFIELGIGTLIAERYQRENAALLASSGATETKLTAQVTALTAKLAASEKKLEDIRRAESGGRAGREIPSQQPARTANSGVDLRSGAEALDAAAREQAEA